MKDWKKFLYILAAFLACFYLPIENIRFNNAVFEALALVKWYAREHVLLCLVPAFFIAGAISVFVSQASVMKYFGARANKFLSYSVASVSGTILAVCSCTVLPLFAGIYKRGAGLGPAIAFLYSGPAINVLAIILTARILGWRIGLARAIGAIIFSFVIGLLMHLIFLKEERARQVSGDFNVGEVKETRSLVKTVLYFASMIAFLVFANLGKPLEVDHRIWSIIYQYKWWIAGFSLASLAVMLIKWFKREELKEWTGATWGFALQILPLLLGGVLVSGFLLGRVGHEGVIPSRFVAALVGGNSLWANFFSSIVAAFMYFATLTEVPILQGLIGSGMGKGPALALLLAGPALSLPSMLVLRSIMGTKKTAVYAALVVVMATISGMIFGAIVK
ncbi:MAG: permease [Omnitrophica WOR_2 bacterium RBG_13_44_8b]|nr:MAG: permease [Omnitrophica WOR_2 bacterium RBG_13_44_8b]